MEYRILPKTGWKISAVSFGCMSLGRGQGAESKEQGAGGRGQGAEGKEQRAEGREQGAEGGGHSAWGRGHGVEGKEQRAEGRGQSAGSGEHCSELKAQSAQLKAQSSAPTAQSTKHTAHSPERLLHQAIDLGINYFDTADLYDQGLNEIIVGKALHSKRQGLYIATKVGNQLRPDGSGWDWNPHKDYILKAVEDSLKRLQTDYIDIYQLHGGTIDDPIDETIEAFELLKEQGKIRAYGISSIRPNVIREYATRSNMVSVMMQYSLLDRRPEESCLELLKTNNIGVMVRGAVAKGLLAGKPAKEYMGYSEKQVNKAAMTLKQIAGSQSTQGQVALQFALRGPAVCSVVAGMSNEDQLRENVDALQLPPLDDVAYQSLRSVLEPQAYTAHR